MSTNAPDLGAVVGAAKDVAASLSGMAIDAVSTVKRVDQGFVVAVEAVESRHVPNDRDILCTLKIELDAAGAFVGMTRDRRYRRGDV